MRSLRYLLLQTRNAGDPMAAQEVRCFARALGCEIAAIEVFDLLGAAPTMEKLRQPDVLLLGGSGHYSAAEAPVSSEPGRLAPRVSPWLVRALETMRGIHYLAKPTFASCWGFQAMARAMGGRCIHDLPSAEIGTIELMLTPEGREDPLFRQLPSKFVAQAGHEDHVVQLPADAVLLASSPRVPEQAFRFTDRPIYCTQFHPELDRATMRDRVLQYPEYVARIARVSFDEFMRGVEETPEANSLLRRFVELVFS
jgi:GMP synthase (glutamine-hydrolysing)